MVENESGSGIVYKPSFLARLAGVALPLLQRQLPRRLFEAIYDVLYAAYKKGLRAAYFWNVLSARLFGDVKEATKRSLTFKLLPYTMGGWRALENAFDITALVEQKGIDGALVECGVAEGGTAAMMALTNRELGTIGRRKWLFDSYEGLPEPTAEDYKGGKVGEAIRPLGKGSCVGTLKQVQDLMFGKLSFSKDDVHLVKGWFQDTLPVHREKIGPIAVLRLDGDWYESTKLPLELLFDQLSPGGYVIVDDYATCFGSHRAVEEFRANRRISTPLFPDGRGGAWFEKPARDEEPNRDFV